MGFLMSLIVARKALRDKSSIEAFAVAQEFAVCIEKNRHGQRIRRHRLPDRDHARFSTMRAFTSFRTRTAGSGRAVWNRIAPLLVSKSRNSRAWFLMVVPLMG